jgi:hypothetical protein
LACNHYFRFVPLRLFGFRLLSSKALMERLAIVVNASRWLCFYSGGGFGAGGPGTAVPG